MSLETKNVRGRRILQHGLHRNKWIGEKGCAKAWAPLLRERKPTHAINGIDLKGTKEGGRQREVGPRLDEIVSQRSSLGI